MSVFYLFISLTLHGSRTIQVSLGKCISERGVVLTFSTLNEISLIPKEHENIPANKKWNEK